jgi:histidinol-phosphate aminotransferase
MPRTPSPYIKSALRSFDPYVPGEQPPADERLVKLNTNENPYPPSPRVIEALRNYDEDALRRYPDPVHTALRQAAGNLLGLSPDLLIAGNGSDELLAMILRAFLDPGDRVALPSPTYSLYPTLTLMHGGIVVERPAPLGGSKVESVLDVDAKITFIASPNSPDGYLVERNDIVQLCRARHSSGIVVVDEAYVDFTHGDVADLVEEFDNLIVTRTLSKSFSLAGLRVGIAAACPALMDALWAVKDSYNLGGLPQALAVAALRDSDYMRANAATIIATRSNTSHLLEERGWKVYPSHANFIFAEPGKEDAGDLYRSLSNRGIFVRYFSYPPLDKGLRISIGSAEQMQILMDALDEIRRETP